MNYVLVIKPNGTKVRYPATPDKVIPAKPGDEIVLVDHNGEPVDVDLKADEEDLLVTFEDGLSVTLQDFYNEDGDLDPVTIGIKPSIDSFDTYEFNSQVGNLPSEGEFSLMRFSNTRGLDFLDPRSGTLGIFSAAEGASTDFMSPVPEDKNPAATADSSGSGGATGDQATTTENAPTVIDLLANDSDPEGGTLRIYAIQGVPVAAGDTVNLPGGGKVLLNVDGTVTYTPGEDFNSLGVGEEAVDTFSYSIIDQGGNVASSTVSVTILGENDGPLAENDFARGAEDQPIYNIPVLGNDTDADGDTLSIVGTPTASNGVVGVNPNGSLNYIPNADFNGVDTITYTITDPHGATSTATVSVVVDAVNDLPVANPDVASVNEDSSLTGFDLIGNDTDVDGDTLTLSGTPTAENGTIVVNGDGTIDYTPDPDFTGTDVITYIVSDGNGGSDTSTLTVTVNPVNDAPVGVNDVAMTDEDARIYNLDVLKNDTDVDGDTLSIQGVPTANNGTISVNSDGTLNYTPDADFNGTDTITYIVEDGNGASDTATVTVTVNAVNDAPVAVSDIGSGNEDVSITGNVL
ncbi:Ig-like domain-containing protein, partial [Verrucomicrobiales bacterium BCK34]|nr:Ig-like domain-containing protein [Verrucomicrobiales bacterium BCK34]